MTAADEIRSYTSGVLRARAAYHADPTTEQLARSAEKRRRKAAAQKRYRDRLKEKNR